jgi:small subunit ribosomal protein S2
MKQFIFGERGGIYIIDLQKTTVLIDEACDFLKKTAERGGNVLFVGTKKQCQETIKEQAERVGMPFVSNRWLGGLLTNYATLSKRIKRMHELKELSENGSLDLLPTREAMQLRADLRKLEQNLGGVGNMDRLPAAVFVVDPRKEAIVVKEARKLKIPIIGLVDTNCDPDEIDYIIPGNDDAIRSCSLIIRTMADAVAQGRQLLTEAEMKAEAERKAAEDAAVAAAVAAQEAEAAEQAAAVAADVEAAKADAAAPAAGAKPAAKPAAEAKPAAKPAAEKAEAKPAAKKAEPKAEKAEKAEAPKAEAAEAKPAAKPAAEKAEAKPAAKKAEPKAEKAEKAEAPKAEAAEAKPAAKKAEPKAEKAEAKAEAKPEAPKAEKKADEAKAEKKADEPKAEAEKPAE